AIGTRISLLRNDPFATAQTTGSSRSAFTPVTCWALSARSSPNTPAVFLAATLVIVATSSRTVAMSSIRMNKLLPAMARFLEVYMNGRRFNHVLPRQAIRRSDCARAVVDAVSQEGEEWARGGKATPSAVALAPAADGVRQVPNVRQRARRQPSRGQIRRHTGQRWSRD